MGNVVLFPRTQKARGIVTLGEADWPVPNYKLIQNLYDLEGVGSLGQLVPWGGSDDSLFARACPIRPRHGFVDSRVVRSLYELKRVFIEALKEDPHAEVILMPFVNSIYSVVWRPGLLSVGRGHDGATAGKDSVGIPVLWQYPDPLSIISRRAGVRVGKGICQKCGEVVPVDEKHCGEDPTALVPFIEAVMEDRNKKMYRTLFTQIREGYAPPGGCVDYIPEETLVEEIARVNQGDDLLEWERRVKTFRRGTVVWHPGGTLGSHYSMHCIDRRIPVLISREPQVGEVLKKLTDLLPPDPSAVARGVIAGIIVAIDGVDPLNPLPKSSTKWPEELNYGSAALGMLTGLHNSPVFQGEAGFYLGVAASLMFRLGTAASLGEARHANRAAGRFRHYIYGRSIAYPVTARSLILGALKKFYHHSWDSAYGGNAWAGCTEALCLLDNAMLRILKEPTGEAVVELRDALNLAVNQAHNGGWWLGKFGIGKGTFDAAAEGDPRVFAAGAPVLYEAAMIPGKTIDAWMGRWKRFARIPVEKVRKRVQVAIAKLRLYEKIEFTNGKFLVRYETTKGGELFTLELDPALATAFAKIVEMDYDYYKSKVVEGWFTGSGTPYVSLRVDKAKIYLPRPNGTEIMVYDFSNGAGVDPRARKAW